MAAHHGLINAYFGPQAGEIFPEQTFLACRQMRGRCLRRAASDQCIAPGCALFKCKNQDELSLCRQIPARLISKGSGADIMRPNQAYCLDLWRARLLPSRLAVTIAVAAGAAKYMPRFRAMTRMPRASTDPSELSPASGIIESE